MFAVSKNNPHRGGILTCAHMLPPSSQRKSSQREDFELGLHASHHLKNNPPKGRIPKRWDKNRVQEIGIINRVLLIEGYLHVSDFYSEPMPTTWAEWKHKTSLLDNQWRRSQDTQLKAATTKPSLFHSPPVVTSTATAIASSSSFSKSSATATPPAPQPMDLDRTNLVKKDPCSGLCFNCGKLGHIMKVCRGPPTQNVQNVNAATTLRLAPEDFQLLIESIKLAMVLSAPMLPVHELEGEKTPGEESF